MTDQPPHPPSPSERRPSSGAHHPFAAQLSLGDIHALVEGATGADAEAIEGLEAILARLRRARDARTRLAVDVPTELLRQVLVDRASSSAVGQPARAVRPRPFVLDASELSAPTESRLR